MEVKKNIQLVYTKEELLTLLRADALTKGYSFEDKSAMFVGKGSRKLSLKRVVINGTEVDVPEETKEEKDGE